MKKVLIISAIWCSSCLILKKQLKKIQNKYENITIEELDYDLDEEKVLEYNVGTTLPVIILIDSNDLEITRLIGEKKDEEIEKFIEGVLT